MFPLKTHLVEKELAYTGVELRPHFILSELGVQGSCVAAFVGPCSVKTEHLVDYEDSLARDFIAARQMLHVLGEFFGMPLAQAVWAQRLLMAQAFEELLARGVPASRLRRDGDDLFVDGAKLSVSIVTASPVSSLLHAGINVDPAGAPVKAIGLGALEIDAREFAAAWLARFAREWTSIADATTKVRPVS